MTASPVASQKRQIAILITIGRSLRSIAVSGISRRTSQVVSGHAVDSEMKATMASVDGRSERGTAR